MPPHLADTTPHPHTLTSYILFPSVNFLIPTVFSMDLLAESRLTFRQIQPLAMIRVSRWVFTKTCQKKGQTRGHFVGIVWRFEVQKKCALNSVVSVQAKSCQARQNGQQHRPYLGGEGRAVQNHNLCVSATQSTCNVFAYLHPLAGTCTLSDGRCHNTCCTPDRVT